MKEGRTTTINLMGKDYQVSCPEGREESLFKASEYLNEHIDKISSSRNMLRMDKIVIQSALNMANELLDYKKEQEHAYEELNDKLSILQTKLDNALSKTKILDHDS